MKKILLTLLAVAAFGSTYCAETAADKLKAFIRMEKGHMDDWFDYMKNHAVQKTNILKKHYDEWADFKQTLIAEWNSGKPVSDQFLVQAIALHKKQNGDWKALNDSIQSLKASLVEKHLKDLSSFESKNISNAGQSLTTTMDQASAVFPKQSEVFIGKQTVSTPDSSQENSEAIEMTE